MASITPFRKTISDRFPVASFSVHVPPQRVFEIACATDPSLFLPQRRAQRTRENFYTSRESGLLRAPAGQATWLLPPEQLRRFAGKRRIYYTVASFGDVAGAAPELTALPGDPGMPFVALSPDFTGRTLDRSRLRGAAPPESRYGGGAPQLAWGGDALTFGSPVPQPAPRQAAYDDGYPPDLWSKGLSDPNDPPEPDLNTPEPPGYEDAPALRGEQDGEAYGRRSDGGSRRPPLRASALRKPPAAEPPGLEEPPRTATYGRPAPRPQPQAPVHREEPPGLEEPPRPVRAYGQRATSSEPPGAADPSELRGPRGRYGDGAPAVEAPPAVTPAAPFTPPGVDDQYDASEDDEGELPPRAPIADGSLTIVEKFRLLQPTARFQSGPEGYACVNADGEFADATHAAYQRKHYGLHWGLVQAVQRSGALGRVLAACQRRDDAKFRAAFGPASDELLRVTNAATEEERLAPVEGAPLWQEPWLGRFRAAGAIPEFQAAQNEDAIEGSFDPNLAFAAALGFDSDRAVAMLYALCVELGNAGGRRFIAQAVSPAKDDALLQQALQALGHDSVGSFQRSAGLHETGTLGPKGHAALVAALRASPQAALPVPPLEQMLDALVAASRGRRFERRVAELRALPELSDTRRLVS